MDWHQVFSLDGMSHHVNITCMKDFTAMQADYVFNKCKIKGVTSSKQVHGCECNDEKQTDSKLNPYECVMLNSFALYNAHTESAEMESGTLFHYKSRLC